MPLKFIADADLNERILDGVLLRESAIDFVSATPGGTRGVDDPKVLGIAAEAGRILVSHDCNTMIGHFYNFIETRQSPGLLIIPQRLPIGIVVDRFIVMWIQSDAAKFRDVVQYLSINDGA